jgi:uncharacterized protein DUF4153
VRVQLPSLGDLVAAAYATLRRFPLVLAAGAVAAFAAILTAEDAGPDALHDRLLAAASLGLPLFTALTLVAERKVRATVAHAALGAGGIVVLGFVYALWPGWSEQVRFFRYAQLTLAFHLMVATLPLWGIPLANAFWQFNRALLERFVTAAVFAATLWGGLALALAAVHTLFGVDVPPEGYFRLWALMAFIFNTWFFLGGVPAEPAALETHHDYPKVLRVFAQYTLVPLVTVYLLILTVYLGKVLITRDWPSGWIGWLVSGVATTGILTLLLVQPVAEDPAQRWVVVFARNFWLAVLPAVVMLWLAIWQRVRQYGITEPRYFLLVLSLWLAGLAVYYSITRSRQIRVIPFTLGVVALLSFAGPWGAYGVSLRSQVGRLRAVLERRGHLVGGHVVRAGAALSSEEAVQVSAVVRYLVERRGTATITPWFRDSADARLGLSLRGPATGEYGGEQRVQRIVEAMGVEYRERWESDGGARRTFNFTVEDHAAIELHGYDVLLSIRGDSAARAGLVAFAAPREPSVHIERDGQLLLSVPLDSLVARAVRQRRSPHGGQLPAESLRADAENASARAAVYLRFIRGVDSAGTRTVSTLNGEALVDLKP